MASLKDTSCMAAELAAASASFSIFRKGLLPSAKSSWLNFFKKEANVLDQMGCGLWCGDFSLYLSLQNRQCVQCTCSKDFTSWCRSWKFLCGDRCVLCSFSRAHESWLDPHSSECHPPWRSWNQEGDFGVCPLETFLSLLTKQHAAW